MKKILSILFSRMIIFGICIAFQIIALIIMLLKFDDYFVYFYSICTFLSFIVILWILNNRDNPAYKIAWIVPILIFPIFGGLFYLMFGHVKLGRKERKELTSLQNEIDRVLIQDPNIMKELLDNDKHIANQAEYILKNSYFPVWKNTTSEYLSLGEIKFKRLLQELKKAKHYIFLEYFIIEEGIMWNSILEILIEKVKEGVDVRVIYDDIGCLVKLPYKYNYTLQKLGIKCQVFNPFVPLLSIRMNNRDHRKIAIIDGHTAFTGGINLADEYINKVEKFGHWKDSAIMLKGDAVWNFTVMFLSTWNYLSKTTEDFSKYKPNIHHVDNFDNDGFVLPYGDTPLDSEIVGESVYINMLNKAKDYVYINTPYLIADNETINAFCLAAKSGVDVRIVTPHIPDKWYVHMMTRSYYPMLIESGVKIYEYTPGFVHAKSFVSDDETAVIGTINLDYRSLYLHFECATWLYKSKSVLSIKEDYLKTLELCQEITLEDCAKVKWYTRFMRSLMRIFAPLL